MYGPDIKYTAEFLRGMSREDLVELEHEARVTKHEVKAQMRALGGSFRGVHLPKKIKADIVRIKTIMGEGS